jgi:hypothetical protein
MIALREKRATGFFRPSKATEPATEKQKFKRFPFRGETETAQRAFFFGDAGPVCRKKMRPNW